MINSSQHEMQLETTHPTGVQEWACPLCGRRFIMQVQPAFNIIDLETGDYYARHFGSTSDELRIGRLQIEEQILSEELSDALDELDLDEWFGTMD